MVHKLGFLFIVIAALFCAAGAVNLLLEGNKVTSNVLVIAEFLAIAMSLVCKIIDDEVIHWKYITFLAISIMIMIYQFKYSSTLI